jgi:hypothetical protein
LSGGATLISGESADIPLDAIQLADPLDRLGGNRRFAGIEDVVELSSRISNMLLRRSFLPGRADRSLRNNLSPEFCGSLSDASEVVRLCDQGRSRTTPPEDLRAIQVDRHVNP